MMNPGKGALNSAIKSLREIDALVDGIGYETTLTADEENRLAKIRLISRKAIETLERELRRPAVCVAPTCGVCKSKVKRMATQMGWTPPSARVPR